MALNGSQPNAHVHAGPSQSDDLARPSFLGSGSPATTSRKRAAGGDTPLEDSDGDEEADDGDDGDDASANGRLAASGDADGRAAIKKPPRKRAVSLLASATEFESSD